MQWHFLKYLKSSPESLNSAYASFVLFLQLTNSNEISKMSHTRALNWLNGKETKNFFSVSHFEIEMCENNNHFDVNSTSWIDLIFVGGYFKIEPEEKV
jgi:hypothetical protein